MYELPEKQGSDIVCLELTASPPAEDMRLRRKAMIYGIIHFFDGSSHPSATQSGTVTWVAPMSSTAITRLWVTPEGR